MMRTLPLLALLLAACGGDDAQTTADAAVDASPDAPAGDPVTIRFAAKVNGQPFACGQTYANVGSPAADYEAQDFRLFVHDVKLIAADDSRVPVALDHDAFQRDGLALLDFEDGTSGCPSGTAATHTSLTGRAPAGTYTGIELSIGVPADLDHLDAATADPPLDDTTMWWVWRAGYKFVRIDGTANGITGFPFHLGSTGCPGSSPVSPPTGPCDQPNTPTVTLTGFDPTTATITADLGALLATTNLAVNASGTADGCQSEPTDPDCAGVFASIGLPFGSAAAGEQTLFSAP